MKAIIRHHYGGPEVLELKDIAHPLPQKNELLIRVHATTVNRTDCGVLTGLPLVFRLFIGFPKPKRLITGTDFAGVVEAIGAEVTNFKVGDRVWGLDDEGLQSQAQYMTIKANKTVLPIPDGFSYSEIVACAEGAHYAYNFINKLTLVPGNKVLVNGATGAIGSAGLQILKSMGIYVTAVANTKNIELVKDLGADKVYDYEKEDFTKDTERYHLIFDAVGKSRFIKCKHLLLEGGIYSSSELGPRWENTYLPLLTRFSKRRAIFPIPSNVKHSLLEIAKLIKRGQFKAVIDRTYTMNEAKEAYRYVMSGQKTGNVIMQID